MTSYTHDRAAGGPNAMGRPKPSSVPRTGTGSVGTEKAAGAEPGVPEGAVEALERAIWELMDAEPDSEDEHELWKLVAELERLEEDAWTPEEREEWMTRP